MRTKTTLLAVALFLITVTGAHPAQATFPGANGRVAFVAHSFDGDSEPPVVSSSIDTALPDSTDRRTLRGCNVYGGPPELNDCSISYGAPAWSPDGKHVAFDAGSQLAVMRADGSGFRLLRRQTMDDSEPAWSPNGRRLVFTGTRQGGGQPDLYILDLLSEDSRRLTFRGGRMADWSSRDRIAFVRGAVPERYSRAGDVYVIRPSGKGLRRITDAKGASPSWSPHGTKLLFAPWRRGHARLYAITLATGALRIIRTDGDSPENPVWSPNGRRIAYNGFESGVWSQTLTGRLVRQIADSQYSSESGHDSYSPDWQPIPK